MRRSFVPEILDDPNVSEETLARARLSLTAIHRFLGNTSCILSALRKGPERVQSVLDVGCGGGGLLAEIRTRLGAEVIGVDLRPPAIGPDGVPIVAADAVRDPLPVCDAAVGVMLAHHLTDADLVGLIRNVGRYCRRLILLDPVRHPLPLALFRFGMYPFLNRINARDGVRSVERSFTPAEFRSLAARAIDGTSSRFTHRVAPFLIRQVLDITFAPPTAEPPAPRPFLSAASSSLRES
jgi:SAM-dependent methyltransferase